MRYSIFLTVVTLAAFGLLSFMVYSKHTEKMYMLEHNITCEQNKDYTGAL
jgi:hypothetical protein